MTDSFFTRPSEVTLWRLTRADIDKIISESCFTGIATQQTEDYLREVRAVLAANREFLDKNIDVAINV